MSQSSAKTIMETTMTDLSRRGFLRGLVAVAVAAQVPQLAPAQAATLADEITAKVGGIVVNGHGVENISVAEAGNGWYRVAATFRDGVGDSLKFDFSRINDGKGLAIMRGDMADEYLRKNPGHVVTDQFVIPSVGAAGELMTFSMFVKPQSAGAMVFGTNVEMDAPAAPTYVETTKR